MAGAAIALMGMERAWQVWATSKVGFDGASAIQRVETHKSFAEAVEAAERVKQEGHFTAKNGYSFECEFSHIQKVWA